MVYEDINGKENLSILIDNLIAILTVHLERFDREIEVKFPQKGKVKSKNQEYTKHLLRHFQLKKLDI